MQTDQDYRYQLLFNTMSEGFALHEIILDDDGNPFNYRFLEINPAFERLTGLKKEAVLGKTVREVIPTIESYWIESYGRVALEGIPIRIENYSAALNDWYEVYAYCPAPRQVAVLFTNITERKRSEEAIEEARKQLERERNLLKFMIDSAKNFHLAYLDRDFNFVRVNEAYAKSCGYTPDAMVGRNHFALYPHAENQAIFTDVRDSGMPVEYHDKPFVFPDQPENGVTYWNWSLTPVKDSSGKIEGLILSLFETTKYKRSEQALRESENRFQQLFEDDLTGDFVCTSEGKIVLCNPAFAAIFGFSSKEEAVGMSMLALYIDPAERQIVLDALKRHGKLERYEAWRKRRNGEAIHVVENLVGHFNAQGELYEYQGYIIDDTERKRTEQALRKNEERFRALVKASSEVLYRMSPDWSEMRQLQGGGFLADIERPIRDWLQEYIHPDDQPQLTAAINEAIRTKSMFVFEHRVRQADGTFGWAFSRAVPLLDENGNILEWFGAASDFTARKRAEEALRKSLAEAEEGRRLLEALMEHIPMGITIADAPDVNIRMESRYGRELTAKPREQIEGIAVDQHAEKWQIYHADGLTPAANEDLPLTRATQKGEMVEEEEWVIGRPDGTKIPVLCTGAPIYDAHGCITAGVVGWQDIRERKRIENSLRRLNETLELRVTERTALAENRAKQLQALAVELIEAEERERRQFAQLLHDDLQQMLAAAKMQLQAVLESLPNEVLLKNVYSILGESITKTRDLSHDLSPAVLHRSGLVAGLEWLSGQMENKFGLSVQLETNRVAHVDSAMRLFLFRAVQELLFNVIKHAEVKEARVLITESEKNITITVIDEGKGFDFDKLSTAERPGFGLLSIEERAVYIGGAFNIDSAPGKGSRFTLTIPIIQNAKKPELTEQTNTASIPSISSQEGIRVLFADDHKVMRQGLIKLIIGQQPDIQVVGEAASGHEALEITRNMRPNVVIMDVSMPGMDGIEATRHIKAEVPDTRVIGLSMYDDKHIIKSMLDAGAESFISKSASTAELVKAIYGNK